MKRAYILILFPSYIVFGSCLIYHTTNPVLEDKPTAPSACISSVSFRTMISGLPPDIEVKEIKQGDRTTQDVKVKSDPLNGQSHPQLDLMAREVFLESGILTNNPKEGQVPDGIFIQINNRLEYPLLGYTSMLFSTITLTILPGHNVTTETFDVIVFENKKFLFKKSYTHAVSQWQWLPLLFFFWAGEDLSFGKVHYKNVLKDTLSEIISLKKKSKKC